MLLRALFALVLACAAFPTLAQTSIDVFLIGGQSNALGAALDPQSSPIPRPGTAFQFFKGEISPALDPVGNVPGYGTAWPSFAITYHRLTGRRVLLVPAARGGTAQVARVAKAQNVAHWDDGGEMVPAAVAALDAAMAAAKLAGYAPTFRGVQWMQGEAEAIALAERPDLKLDPAEYSAAFLRMVARFHETYGRPIPFFVYRIGCATDIHSGDEPGFKTIRAEQDRMVARSPQVRMVFRGASRFCKRGLMRDSYHFKQRGYNEMGTAGAIATVFALPK